MPTLPEQNFGSLAPAVSAWANNFAFGDPALVATSHGTLMVFPLCPPEGVFPGVVTARTLLVGMSGSGGTADSGAHTLSMSLGLYALANSTQLSLVNSASSSMGTGVASVLNRTLFNGPRQISLASSQWSAVPAFSRTHYWLGLHLLSSGSAIPVSISGFEWMASNYSGFVGVGNTDSSASRPFPGMGVFSASFSSALPSVLAFSDLRQADPLAGQIPTIVIHNIGA